MAETKTAAAIMSEAETVDLEYKKMLIARMQREMSDENERVARMRDEAYKRAEDARKGEQERARRQLNCKHRKGGRDNKFAQGTASEHSINMNIYPNGEKIIMCTRCFKEVPKPDIGLKKINPKLYAAMLAEWKEWSNWPTDNIASGSQIYQKVQEAA